jgi:hypothetical protein
MVVTPQHPHPRQTHDRAALGILQRLEHARFIAIISATSLLSRGRRILGEKLIFDSNEIAMVRLLIEDMTNPSASKPFIQPVPSPPQGSCGKFFSF